MMTKRTSLAGAESNCRANNMKLFRVYSTKAQTYLTNFVQDQLYHYTESSIWIDDSSSLRVYTSQCADDLFSICEFSANAYPPTKSENNYFLE